MRKKYILTFSLLFLASCKSIGPSKINSSFNEKYGKQAEMLKNHQNQMQTGILPPSNLFEQVINESQKPQNYANPAEIINVAGPNEQLRQNRYKTENLQTKKPKHFTPDAQTIAIGASNFAPNKIPNDIFEISYNTNQHPPFSAKGMDFDVIAIPKKDAFGIDSDLESKRYEIAGNDVMQRSIDYYDSKRTKEDLQFSEILIKEQEQIFRQKKQREIFGYKEEKKEQSEEEKNWAKIKKEKRNDPVRKIIAAQVVAYNTYKNSNKNQNQNQNQNQ